MSDMDLGYDDESETPDTDETPDSSTIKGIRAAQREALKRAKTAEAELATVRASLAEREAADRKAQIGAIAISLGLPAGQAALVPSDLEATAEAVSAWAVRHDLLRPEAAPQEEAPARFVPVTGGGGVAPDLMVSLESFQAMYANPATRAEAERLYLSGRVKGLSPDSAPERL